MHKIFSIGFQAFREECRRKTLYLFFLFSLLCICASTVFVLLAPGSERIFVIDVSLSSISFFIMLIIASITCDLFLREEQYGTLYFFVTNPVRWGVVVFGKIVGILGFLIFGVFFMGGVLCSLFYLKFHDLDPNLVKAIFLLIGETVVLLACGALGASLFSKFTNFLFVMTTYMLGHLVPYFHHFQEHLDDSTRVPLKWFFKFIPNLNRFEARDLIVLGLDLKWARIFSSFFYAVLLTIFLGSLCSFFLKKRYDK